MLALVNAGGSVIIGNVEAALGRTEGLVAGMLSGNVVGVVGVVRVAVVLVDVVVNNAVVDEVVVAAVVGVVVVLVFVVLEVAVTRRFARNIVLHFFPVK